MTRPLWFVLLPVLMALSIGPLTASAARADKGGTVSDEFLGHLAGSWNLTGTMGSAELRQKVDAGWVLGGRFLRLHFVEQGPAPAGRTPYEAVYVLGFDEKSGEYVLHLFDTFGPEYARTLGIGKRDGNSVEFLFHYPTGWFSNRFTWDPRSGRWQMLLRQKEGTGEWKEFARKVLTRA